MSRTNNSRGNSRPNESLPPNPSETQDYEDLIRRLKLLSKTQSTFLKLYLQGKLSSAASIVSRALVKIRHLKKEDSSLIELETALANLKLEELDVDYTNAEIMLREELATLSNVVWNGNSGTDAANLPVAIPAGGGNSDRNHSLETDNANLRSLLAEAKAEILMKEKQLAAYANAPAVPPVPPSAISSAPSVGNSNDVVLKNLQSELSTLQTKLADKDREMTTLRTQINEKDSEIDRVNKKYTELSANSANSAAGGQAEVGRLKGEISDLQAAVEKAKAEGKANVEKVTSELKGAHEKQIKELEAKMEHDKDEMMDAMTAEVELVEQKHREEGAATSAELQRLRDNLSKVSGANTKLGSGLRRVKKKLGEFKKLHISFKGEVKTQVQDMKTALKEQYGRSLIGMLKDYDTKMEDMKRKYKKELTERKKLHNQLQELRGNIRVYMRSRPPSQSEIENHGADALCVTFLDENEVKLQTDKGKEKNFEFDEVFNLSATQDQIYQEVSPLVQSVLDGYNVCIFAYGQTGSGKTYTMNGPPDNRGVNTRALDDLFTKSQGRSDEWTDSIMVSILEVYNETIRDLLVAGGGDDKLEIRQSEFGNIVTNLTVVPVSSLVDVEQLMATADRNRSQACTNMNEHSSRSHMMIQVTLIGENRLSGQVFRGKLNLVDLAGSERIDKSGATGQALKEAQNINKSLSALGDVIQARANKSGHIPFRNSTLTYLLQDSLSQDSKTLMFVCISPSIYNAEESLCSLNFASRVRTVELGKANKKMITKSESTGSASTSRKSTAPTTSGKK